MKVFAISDFHLSNTTDKPMDIFGDNWTGHFDKIKEFFENNVSKDDIVLSAGDTSWGMNIPEAIDDLKAVDALNGIKFIIKGNHDYWWSSYEKIKSLGLDSINFIQNNAFKIGEYVICGTRGWTVPENESDVKDKKIFAREAIRLKLTLDAALKLRTDNERILLLTHYPPFNSRFEDSEFTDIISQYPVDKVIYGHLHGNRSRYSAVVNKNNLDYLLTSCDFLSFIPLRIY